MPAIPLRWMDPKRWQGEPMDWATSIYRQLAPQVSVKGRMALILFLAVVWAFAWLIIRAYSVINTPNDVLVDKLGLDIPPAPALTLEGISAQEIQIAWKHADPQNSVQAHFVELNGKIVDQTKRNENAASILNLVPGTLYDVRVFTVSATRFQTPSSLLHVRTTPGFEGSSQDDSHDGTPYIRAYASRSSTSPTPPSAPLMAREHSGGQPVGRRGTNGRRASPAYIVQEPAPSQAEEAHRGIDDEVDGNLAQLSERFQKVQLDTEGTESQIVEEEEAFEVSFRELEKKRDELKHSLKERDEASGDLKKQVHKMETASRTAQSEKSKKERLLQQKENQRKKRRDEIARWEDQISSMTDEMAGIETQKAAIERRTQSEIREIRHKIEEEQRDVKLLDEENKTKALQIKDLEDERRQSNTEHETEESREDDRLEFERDARWRYKIEEMARYYGQLQLQLDQANREQHFARERLNMLEYTRRAPPISFSSSIPPLDMDAVRRGGKVPRRARHGSSLASSISSPRAAFPSETYAPSNPYVSLSNISPTTTGASLFNPQNLMTIRSDSPTMSEEELDAPDGAPMSPRADSLLPADLLGDESADEMAEDELPMPTKPTATDSGTTPFPPLRPQSLRGGEAVPSSPSPASSSSRSFSSPRESFTNMMFDPERKSLHSGQASIDQSSSVDTSQAGSRKLMSNIFSFNRQRGKTMADEPPSLGSLKSAQSQSFPRNFGDDLDPASQRRRRLSYGGNWAFPGNLLPRTSVATGGKDAGSSRLSTGRRAFPGLFSGLGKSSTAAFDPFGSRTDSFDADIRVESSSPRPSSTYSFDKMLRPSMESQFRAWGPERSGLRGSPLAPDWASFHSYSRNPSRRPSVHYGSTSNLSIGAQADEDFLQAGRELPRPLQAPIGTRPASSQRPLTPKLNPAAPSFTTLFGKRTEKNKDKSKGKELLRDKSVENVDDMSPPASRKSKETPSIAATGSTMESRESLERTTSGHSAGTPMETTPQKPTFISKITRKASSNKFGSWKEKGGLFSRKESSNPNAEIDEDTASATEQLGKSLESTSTTPSGEEKKASRTSLSWSFMRKSKKGGFREDLAASEVSESSERASEVGTEDGDDDG